MAELTDETMTTATSPSRGTRTDRASLTREAILTAAERLFAEHGVFAVSNRQVSEAAGQGNNAAVGYHFGTKTDLVRAIEHKHAIPVEKLRQERVAALGSSTELRDWVECLVLPLTDHLTAMGSPTWYARFAAQVMADPAYQQTVSRDALTLPALITVLEGINRCLPDLPAHVRAERKIMGRNLLIHTCAEYERALAEGTSLPLTNWRTAASGLVDAIVGLWLAPVTRQG
ncbi:AcrR family transcriptional regulator [Mycolicibacterium sp. BK634]|uniref:TetR/AcrR family transcriptional regulator n=1 Tax=Mycolicibacterium sp. BK634 TaxID=2587099 RepID=UPI0017DEEB90|nr:AcrR family transcriptional regulator [Mycolicibacterium sp. BK634]